MDRTTLNHLFSQQSLDLLERTRADEGFRGQIPAAVAGEIQTREKVSINDLLRHLVPIAQDYSSAPISNYKVGAACLGESGAIYLGTNIEVPGKPLNFSVHAEQSAFTSAFMHNETSITAIALSAPPCGHCRQFMNEFCSMTDLEVVIAGQPYTLKDLLIASFGPEHLDNPGGAFGVERKHLSLSEATDDHLINSAREAAESSYAPYSNSPSGVSLRTRDGRLYTGCYIENAAFNPSLSPLHAAFVSVVLSGNKLSELAEVVLVELSSATITQEDIVQIAITAVAQSASLKIARAELK